jgi:hypothetical protein
LIFEGLEESSLLRQLLGNLRADRVDQQDIYAGKAHLGSKSTPHELGRIWSVNHCAEGSAKSILQISEDETPTGEGNTPLSPESTTESAPSKSSAASNAKFPTPAAATSATALSKGARGQYH